MRDAIRAGAIGFTTSRSPSHETPDGRPVASRLANWDEVRRLVGAMGEMNAGIFEIAGEGVDRDAGDPGVREWHTRLRDLAVESGGRSPSASSAGASAPGAWQQYLDSARRDRGRGRAHVRAGAQPLAHRAAVVQDADAVRSPAGVEGHPHAAARRAEADSCAIRSCAGKLIEASGERDGRKPARHRSAAGRLRLAVRVRHRRRAASLASPRSRASAASIRPRP